MKDLEIINSTDSALAKEVVFKSIEDFQRFLNNNPDKEDIKVNHLANNSKYLPIGIVEKKLDQIFSGLWSIEILDTKVIVNEIMVTVRLTVKHPKVDGLFLHRDGIGAVQIRMQKGSVITDINSKQKNALTADAPHAYAEAIKNAAKKFGNIFGRNLNRNEDFNDYQTLSEMLVPDDIVNDARQKLAACITTAEIKSLHNDPEYSEWKTDLGFKQLFINRQKEITNLT